MKQIKRDSNRGKSQVHSGHRERLKAKLINSPKSFLEDHELLEILLFYSIPRRNTNEISHELINKFGSIKRVIEASREELETIPYIKQSSVALLKAICEMNKRKSNIKEKYSFNKGYDLCSKSVAKLSSQVDKEGLYVIYVSNKGNLFFASEIEGKNEKTILDFLSYKSVIGFEISGVIVFSYTESIKYFPGTHGLERAKGLNDFFSTYDIPFYGYYEVSKNYFYSLLGEEKYNTLLNIGEKKKKTSVEIKDDEFSGGFCEIERKPPSCKE